jgi:hypothetical protein
MRQTLVRLGIVRVIGPVESHRGLGLQDHFCWVHGDPVDYRARLTDFLTQGLERGLRLGYAGSGRVGALRERLSRGSMTSVGCWFVTRSALSPSAASAGPGSRLTLRRSSDRMPPRPMRRWPTGTVAFASARM